LSVLRERNSSDVSEINQLNYDISNKTTESNQLIAEAQSLEFQISAQKAKIDDMNRLVETRTTDLKSKDNQVIEMESEINTIKNQVVSFENELNHLRSLEDKYNLENSDL
jgi:chromosome segregation ATPase